MARTQTSLLIRLLESSVLFSFVLACSTSSDGTTDPVAETGSIQVSAATTGTDLDSDGYTATVGSTNQSVAANGSTTFAGIATGSHTVTLSGVASNCDVSGTNPASATVVANQTTSVSFAITCEAITSTIEDAIASLEDALFAAINALDNGTTDDLDQFSFEEARDFFQQVLDANPNDETAAFGLAITTIFVLEDNTAIRALADEWDAWLLTHSIDELSGIDLLGAADQFFWPRASLPLDIRGRALGGLTDFDQLRRLLIPQEAEFADYPPTLTEHQALLRDVIAPALETALDALNSVDSPSFTFTITERMQGESALEADPLELDLTEILALRAALETSLALTDAALAYVAEPSPWGAAGFAAAFETGSTFGTLASDGAALLLDTQERLLRAVGLLEQGLDNLVAETDDQSDDIIKYDPTGFDGLDAQDVQEARDLLADAEASLQGPQTITEDFGNGEVMLVVDASKFFTDPIQDLKAILPDYMVMNGRFRWSALTMEEWTFPDPTFNGILPEIASNTELLETLDLESLYFELAFPQGRWRDLAPLPDGRILAFAAQGFLGVLSADLTSVAFGPSIEGLSFSGAAIAVRTSAPEIIAIGDQGNVFARPNDDATAWVQQVAVLPPDFWRALAVTPAGIFALSLNRAVARIEADLTSTSPLAQIGTCCFSSVAMAGNGSLLVTLLDSGELFSTLDPSVGWTLRTTLPMVMYSWTALTSGPANTNFAATDGGEVYQVSADFSSSTQLPSLPIMFGLMALTTNADGSTLVAITYEGRLYSRPTNDPAVAWTEHPQIPRIMSYDLAPGLGGASR